MSDYQQFFRVLLGMGAGAPLTWQQELAGDDECADRLIRVPTGFGKTLGVFGAWAWHRVHRSDNEWPRRLIWCLPMRVLVEQVEAEIRAALDRLDLLWSGEKTREGRVGVHPLMGGSDAGDWHLHPEQCGVLIGTQDMLISRALNRGYAAPRARWPMEFGLLNHDCLWVMDEVQLMDVGLATSGQLQAFRERSRVEGKMSRPVHTWWMSATLQDSWLKKSPETRQRLPAIPKVVIAPKDRTGHLWDDVRKPVRLERATKPEQMSEVVAKAHLEHGRGSSGPTVVVLNRVKVAVEMYRALQRRRDLRGTEFRLVHSRFRPHERAQWRSEFLNRAACEGGVDRIIIATQVIEAGVDISAGALITQIAPWPSLVQRFGRAARWGGQATVIVIDDSPADDRAAAPYSSAEIDAARAALEKVSDVAPLNLERFEELLAPELIDRLYPYEPRHLILDQEIGELFDTTPDLSGADVDISRFIRTGDERDLQVFWQPVEDRGDPPRTHRPSRSELCGVPFLAAREWLCGDKKAQRLLPGLRAWVWDWLGGAWRPAERRDLYPGQVVLVESSCGGYDTGLGWDPGSRVRVAPLPEPIVPAGDEADSAEDDESLSEYQWQTIGRHGLAVGEQASHLGTALVPELSALLHLAGRLHDLGKVHPCFQRSIVSEDRPKRDDLAKAPDGAWLAPRSLYPDVGGPNRRGFRHELASTLALFGILQRHAPDHDALLGPWRALLESIGSKPDVQQSGIEPTEIEREVLDLTADEFDLVAYLVCAHHGKVRVSWHASPADQEAVDDRLRIRGIRDGETLPSVPIATADGLYASVPETELDLSPAALGLSPRTGRSWSERVLALTERHGVFALAWMEAILRSADQRASALTLEDPLLLDGGAR